ARQILPAVNRPATINRAILAGALHARRDFLWQGSFMQTDSVQFDALLAAEQITRKLVGRTVAEVERDLILETLRHCHGNRTHAAAILGISIRTLRNKLNEYASQGTPVPPPGGEMRGAA